MTTSHEERIKLSTILVVTVFAFAAVLMCVGLFGIADGTEYERGMEVFSEVMMLGSLVIGYWFGKRSE